MSYTISLDPDRMQLDVIHGFLSTCYWSPGIRREIVAEAIRNSLVAGAVDSASGEQVGFVRVVTDYASFAWVCDVFVLEGHRGHGLAQRMIDELMRHPRLQTLRRWCLATRDAQGLYRKLGFKPVVEGRWMELRMSEERWREPPARQPESGGGPDSRRNSPAEPRP
ncbi:MAG: GNAT family N-acetyltransferase [Phycisphaerae bacterium]